MEFIFRDMFEYLDEQRSGEVACRLGRCDYWPGAVE